MKNSCWLAGVGALALLLALAAHGQAQTTLNIVASTPEISSDGSYTTWVAPLATALLGQGTPGLFWGTIGANDVNAACDSIVNTGSYDVSASVTGYGQTFDTTFTVTAIGGCRASANSPVGVQAVFTVDSGEEVAIICTDEHTWDLGCSIYMTGGDVTALYNRLKSGGRRKMLQLPAAANATRSNRKMLQLPATANATKSKRKMLGGVGDGIACGAGTAGAAAGGVTAALGCIAAGPFAPLCWAAAGIAVAAGSVGACSGEIENSCFPAHATVVVMPGGLTRRMDQLALGDSVAVRRPDGSIGYEAIYAWGHRSAGVKAEFVRATLVPASATGATATTATLQLEMTPGHFAITLTPSGSLLHKRASDLAQGDLMLAVAAASSNASTDKASGALQQWVVTEVAQVQGEGLYNPYTLGGSLLVNGALASAHSEWYADSLADAAGLPSSWLPALYQATLAPARALWHLLGRERYVALYNSLDARLNISGRCSAGNDGLLGLLRVLVAAVAAVVGEVAAAAWAAVVSSVGAMSSSLAGVAGCGAAVGAVMLARGASAKHVKQA